jgi:hypothetical protein
MKTGKTNNVPLSVDFVITSTIFPKVKNRLTDFNLYFRKDYTNFQPVNLKSRLPKNFSTKNSKYKISVSERGAT